MGHLGYSAWRRATSEVLCNCDQHPRNVLGCRTTPQRAAVLPHEQLVLGTPFLVREEPVLRDNALEGYRSVARRTPSRSPHHAMVPPPCHAHGEANNSDEEAQTRSCGGGKEDECTMFLTAVAFEKTGRKERQVQTWPDKNSRVVSCRRMTCNDATV